MEKRIENGVLGIGIERGFGKGLKERWLCKIVSNSYGRWGKDFFILGVISRFWCCIGRIVFGYGNVFKVGVGRCISGKGLGIIRLF